MNTRVKQEIQDVSKTLAPTIKYDGATGIGVAAAGTYVAGYDAGLRNVDESLKDVPEGVPEKILAFNQQYNTNFLAGAAHAVGPAAMQLCQDNPGLNRVSVTIPMFGKDNVAITYDHVKQVPDKSEGAAEGATVAKHGSLRAQFDMYGEGGNRGQLAIVRDELSALAMERASK